MAVGAEARRGVEVVALGQHGLLAAGCWNGHQGIDRLAALRPVVFADADEAIAGRVEDGVGIAQRHGGGDGFGRAAYGLTIEPLVGEIGEIDDAVVDGVIAAAVFVDARAGIEPGRGHVLLSPARQADDDVAAAFAGASFDPVDGVTIDPGLRQGDGPAHEQVTCDG